MNEEFKATKVYIGAGIYTWLFPVKYIDWEKEKAQNPWKSYPSDEGVKISQDSLECK